MIPKTFVIQKEINEVHALQACPCDACAAERARLQAVEPAPPSNLVSIPAPVARLFGLTGEPLSAKSKARLLAEAGHSDN